MSQSSTTPTNHFSHGSLDARFAAFMGLALTALVALAFGSLARTHTASGADHGVVITASALPPRN
jgi:hypothetical protein